LVRRRIHAGFLIFEKVSGKASCHLPLLAGVIESGFKVCTQTRGALAASREGAIFPLLEAVVSDVC
jgi:hypothetical protein